MPSKPRQSWRSRRRYGLWRGLFLCCSLRPRFPRSCRSTFALRGHPLIPRLAGLASCLPTNLLCVSIPGDPLRRSDSRSNPSHSASVRLGLPVPTPPNQPASGQPPPRRQGRDCPKFVTLSAGDFRRPRVQNPRPLRPISVTSVSDHPATIYRRFRYSARPITLLTGLGPPPAGTYLPQPHSGCWHCPRFRPR